MIYDCSVWLGYSMQAHHMHITVCIYDANALITFVEPNIPLIVGLSVGLVLGGLLLAVVIIVVVACLVRYGKKNKKNKNFLGKLAKVFLKKILSVM